MLAVVGLSFSTEYAIKGAYENTVGRITEIDSYTTPQDRVNTDLSIAYGAFIPDEPWYAFPFHSWLGDVWRTPVFGDSPLRRFERKGFLVTENAIKTGYASVIKKATGAVYGAPDPVVYLTASNVPRDVTSLDPRISVIKQLDNGRTVLSVPHYQGFTETIPLLARAGVTFHDFAGNDEIAITAVIPRDLGIPAFAGRELYRMPVLIDAERERIAILVDVPDLGTAFTFYDENDVFVEHLYDY